MRDAEPSSPNGTLKTHAAAPPTPSTPVSAESPAKKNNPSRPQSRSGGATASPRSWLNNLRRPKTAPGQQGQRPPPSFFARSHLNDDVRRDSALQSGSPTTTAPSTIADPQESRLSRVSSLPAIVVHDDEKTAVATEEEEQNADKLHGNADPAETAPSATTGDFNGITMAIPTGGFEEFTTPEKMQFSNRGSMLLDGMKAAQIAAANGSVNGSANVTPTPRTPSVRSNSVRPDNGSRTSLAARQSRVLSADESELSSRVRSMYEFGNERGVDWSERTRLDDMVKEEEDESENAVPSGEPSSTLAPHKSVERRPSTPNKRVSTIPWEAYEAAGGLEDWQDVAGDEVDRYGFILPKKSESRGSGHSGASPQQGLMRVSTALNDLSETPRRKRTIRRSASKASANRTAGAEGAGKVRRRLSKSSRTGGGLQPPGSIYSSRSASSLSVQQSPLRYASNRLPHNKDRRWMDEASDMLTLPPGLEDEAVAKEGGRAAAAMRKKELQREEKWRKMGKTAQKDKHGGGMLFEFDPKDAKVISRTWKGIPDKWRATAWYSFLAASARKQKDAHSDEELIELFHVLVEEGSPDDVQIDCDVPRTINKHIMFRRRYRGGQRLLFRVLHALSLYFPDSGYVQGMATICATLLCYYDEEHAFIMMVRLWQLRGLDRLYMAGFEGLMEALTDFETNWLRGNDVAKKLVSAWPSFSFCLYRCCKRISSLRRVQSNRKN